jgi:hypothetical protein
VKHDSCRTRLWPVPVNYLQLKRISNGLWPDVRQGRANGSVIDDAKQLRKRTHIVSNLPWTCIAKGRTVRYTART